MNYFQISPQVAGTLGDGSVVADYAERPLRISKLQFELTSWPEDDLIVAMIQGYAGTTRLAEAITAAGLTGIEFGSLEMIEGDQFWIKKKHHQGETIPEYCWFRFTGTHCVDDFGLIPLPVFPSLVVSDRALTLLRSFKFTNADVYDFDIHAQR